MCEVWRDMVPVKVVVRMRRVMDESAAVSRQMSVRDENSDGRAKL